MKNGDDIVVLILESEKNYFAIFLFEDHLSVISISVLLTRIEHSDQAYFQQLCHMLLQYSLMYKRSLDYKYMR